MSRLHRHHSTKLQVGTGAVTYAPHHKHPTRTPDSCSKPLLHSAAASAVASWPCGGLQNMMRTPSLAEAPTHRSRNFSPGRRPAVLTANAAATRSNTSWLFSRTCDSGVGRTVRITFDCVEKAGHPARAGAPTFACDWWWKPGWAHSHPPDSIYAIYMLYIYAICLYIEKARLVTRRLCLLGSPHAWMPLLLCLVPAGEICGRVSGAHSSRIARDQRYPQCNQPWHEHGPCS